MLCISMHDRCHPYDCNRQVLFIFIFFFIMMKHVPLLWRAREVYLYFFFNIPKLSVTKCLTLLGICVF